MTNSWNDLANADIFLIIGANPAENHPCGYKWVLEAKRRRNARILVVDPRFTRTAATANRYVALRAGSDIAFVGGLIRFAIENGHYNRDYLVHYTNASFLVDEQFKLPVDGLFSGFQPDRNDYDRSSWNYESKTSGRPGILPAQVSTDPTLQHPRCVFQLLKRHYDRYTPEMVERITGAPKSEFLRVASEFTGIRAGGDMKKAGSLIYSLGWTHHEVGTQMIRCGAILQLLLGNVGRPGGGVNALRGHGNVQGATDIAVSFDNLPGYIRQPNAEDLSFENWMARITPGGTKAPGTESLNYWSNTPKFAVSLMKALFGDAATRENSWAFDYLAKPPAGPNWWSLPEVLAREKTVRGLFCFGTNLYALMSSAHRTFAGLKGLDWLVVCEIFPDETSEFWKAPHVSAEEMKNIGTTVYRLPGCSFAEKPGTMVNSSRMLEWREAAAFPPGDSKVDLQILAKIFLDVRALYNAEGGKFPEPIRNLTWEYAIPERPSAEELAKELNGRALQPLRDPATGDTLRAGDQLPAFAWIRDDGTTAAGCWIYCGSWTQAGAQTKRRDPSDPSGLGIYPNWAWTWPANRKILYNRASCDLSGKPWDSTRALVWWNAKKGVWEGPDIPDFKATSPPEERMGPFIMNPEGVGRLFTPVNALLDGPFPEHYEPVEGPIANPLHPSQSTNPLGKKPTGPFDIFGTYSQGYNAVAMTIRMTEQYHFWTKNNPMNVLLMPEPFVEISPEMASEIRVSPGNFVKVSSARGYHIARAMVTRRLKVLTVDGKRVYQVGIPFNWGFRGISEDAHRTARTLVNNITPTSCDVNVRTPEFKSFLVKVEKFEGSIA
jgi:formate dehydrogenase major subunit